MYNISVGIGFVHNNNNDRNDIIIPKLKELTKQLQKKYNVEFIEISYQPKVTEHKLSLVIKRDNIYFKLGRKWSKYRELKLMNYFLAKAYFIKNALRKYTKNIVNLYKSSFIETIVTDKHIRAWTSLAEKNDYIIIFEDDAIFKEESINKVERLIEDKLLKIKNSFIYVDLAGGCTINSLEIDNLEKNRDSEYIYYKKIVTNIACSYLINKQTIEFFLKELILNPNLRYIGVDWMINSLLMELAKDKNIKVYCSHSYPSIFSHGSVTGEFNAWIR